MQVRRTILPSNINIANFLRDTLREDTSTYSLLPVGQSLARTIDSGRVVGKKEAFLGPDLGEIKAPRPVES
jgi:hypothetical protein